MSPLRRLARSPLGALLLGYGTAAALLAGVGAWQNGLDAGVLALVVNGVLLTPPVGLVWLVGRQLDRRRAAGPLTETSPWWQARLTTYGLGFAGLVLLAVGPIAYGATVVADLQGHHETPVAPNELALVLLGIVLFAAANATALFAALAVESWARRAE